MFTAMTKQIAAFFTEVGKRDRKSSRFIWTAPLDRAGSVHGVKSTFFDVAGKKGGYQPFSPALRLPGRTHGLNKFRDVNNAALLSIINFTPTQYEILQMLGLTDVEIDRAFGHNIVYQDALRCSLRERGQRGRVHIAVPDLATAQDLAAEFPGCRIERFGVERVPVRAAERQRGKPTSGAAKSSGDRVRAFRARRRAEQDAAKARAKDSA